MEPIQSLPAFDQVIGAIFRIERILEAQTQLRKHSCQSGVSRRRQLTCVILSSFTSLEHLGLSQAEWRGCQGRFPP